jgi:hypothetical protein
MTVMAVKNGAFQPNREILLQYVEEKASGFGLVRFDKSRRKIVVECWPYRADMTQRSTQMPGWPVEIDVLDNYARKVIGHLPTLTISGVKHPVIEVFDAGTGELIYGLRITQTSFRPHVFAPGKYTVRVSDPEAKKFNEARNLEPREQPQPPVNVNIT